jgi:metal-dependent amidase/aminoacylase/carboxypeptidase family protein
MASIVGEDNVLAQEPTMGAEDFAYMLQAKPGAYCFIANGDGATATWAMAAGPARCTTPATTSMTT